MRRKGKGFEAEKWRERAMRETKDCEPDENTSNECFYSEESILKAQNEAMSSSNFENKEKPLKIKFESEDCNLLNEMKFGLNFNESELRESLIEEFSDKDYEKLEANVAMHNGHKQRLRYKALGNIDVLADHEILELILNFGVVRKNTNPLAHYLMNKYGSLRAVMESDYFALMNEPGVGEISACLLTLIPKLMKRYSINVLSNFRTIKNLGEAIHIFKALFSSLSHETLFIACIGEEDRIISIEQVASGTKTQVDVQLAKVLKIVLKHNPIKIILAHNHLVDSAMPSHSDIVFTEAVLSVMKNLNIGVFEHLVLTPGEEYSQLVARTIKFPNKNPVPLPKELFIGF